MSNIAFRRRNHATIIWFITASIICGLGSPLLSARISKDTSVKSFTLRKFDDQGVRLWDLSGREALFVSDNLIRIIDMQLAISSTRSASDRTTLRSPSANIYVDDSFAEGDGFLFIQGDGYTIRGDEWSWDGNEQRVEVRRNSRVTFDEAIQQVLR